MHRSSPPRPSRTCIADDPVAPAAVSRHCFARRRSARERRSSAGPLRVLRFRGVAERGWSSASRARPRRVGCAILSESLRPAFGDQLVDQSAIASTVSERATQLLGCGAPSCGHGVGRVRRPGHDLIVAGGVAANRRSRTRPLATRYVPCLCLGRELASSASGLAVGSRCPRKESVCGKTLARVLNGHAAARRPRRLPASCGKRLTFQAMIASASLARIRSFVMSNCGGLRLGPEWWSSVRTSRSSHPVVWPVRSIPAPWYVGRVVIGTGSDRVVGHAGVGDRPVSRGGAGYRVCCVPEASRTRRRTLTRPIPWTTRRTCAV